MDIAFLIFPLFPFHWLLFPSLTARQLESSHIAIFFVFLTQMRDIKKIGVWPVAFTGAARYAGPLCKDGRVVGFYTNWRPSRTFPLDMAAFAINVKRLIVDKPKAHFDADAKPGDLENSFLEQVGTREDLEARASNCSKVYNN